MLDFQNMKPRDPRPAKAGWGAPPPDRGDYACKCSDCGCTFAGEKRAWQCADCAYGPEQDFASALGARVHARRIALEMTLDELAKKAGITKSYAWELDTGKAKSPGADVVSRVAAAMGLTFGYLVGEIGLAESEDDFFYCCYLSMPEAMKRQIRAIAAVLEKDTAA